MEIKVYGFQGNTIQFMTKTKCTFDSNQLVDLTIEECATTYKDSSFIVVNDQDLCAPCSVFDGSPENSYDMVYDPNFTMYRGFPVIKQQIKLVKPFLTSEVDSNVAYNCIDDQATTSCLFAVGKVGEYFEAKFSSIHGDVGGGAHLVTSVEIVNGNEYGARLRKSKILIGSDECGTLPETTADS